MTETFQTQIFQPGVGGLNLKLTSDLVPPTQLIQMTNVVGSKQEVGELQSRPGLEKVVNAGNNIHSIYTITTLGGNTILVVGADNSIYYGVFGVLSSVDGGYSGDPLWMVAYRPTDSAYSWLFIADSNRMRKIRGDGLVLPIGLPAAGGAVVATLNPPEITSGLPFANGGGWGTFAYNGSGVPSGPGHDANPTTGNGLSFTTNPGGAVSAYANAWDHSTASVDFTQVGVLPASDSDYISFYMKMDHPELINNVTISFGIGGTGGNFYTKSFRPSDFTQINVPGSQTGLGGEGQVAIRQQLDEALNKFTDNRDVMAIPKAQRQQSNAQALQAVTGADSWTLFGTFGVVLRRGDFLRTGADENVGWADVQSVTVTVFVNTNAVVTVSLSDLNLSGGSGPDTGEFNLSSYDYRVINVDTRTGAKSNPTDIMTTGIDSLRTSIVVSPAAYGDSAIRQWIYRRGGTLNDNWYFIGVNSGDGADFLDNISDAQAAQGELLQLDNNQPIATANASGSTVLAQPVPAIFGPAQDYLFACGDPYKPGTVYYSKPGQPDSWPPQNATEVCPPSDVLQSGGVYGTQAFVFSRNSMYWLLPNAGILGAVTSVPTAIKHGMFSRWGLTVGRDGIYYVAEDGIYRTTGGPEEYLSDDIQPLFNDETRNGYLPIDFSVPQALKLETHDNDLWFLFQDTGGNRQIFVYSFLQKYWRHYAFGRSISELCSDVSAPRMLLGGASTGWVYNHVGVSDDGMAIAAFFTTPYLDQGILRQMKSYGDITIDVARNATDIVITPTLDTGITTLFPLAITAETQADLQAKMPVFFRIDEFKSTANNVVDIRDRIRLSCIGFDIFVPPPPPPIGQRLRYTLDPFTSLPFFANTFRIDEFARVADGVISVADRTRFTCVGFSIPSPHVQTGGIPQEARNVSLKVSWVSSTQRPVIFQLGISFIPRVDETKNRTTDWDSGNTLADKYIKGVIVEADTLGFSRTVNVWVDGNSYAPLTIPATTKGRREIFQFSFAQTKGRYFRLVPADSSKWQLFQYQWIFDEEPLELVRWETQELSHGVTEWKAPLFGHITIRSSADVILTVTCYNQTGDPITNTYTIPNTFGLKTKTFVPFAAAKGMLVKYLLTSSTPFALYREETNIAIMPWGAAQYGIVKPFGNDDLDLTRGMYRASGVAERAGGGGAGNFRTQ